MDLLRFVAIVSSPRGKDTRIARANAQTHGQRGKKEKVWKVLFFFGKCKSKKVDYGGMESS